jgi:hypothetical protein
MYHMPRNFHQPEPNKKTKDVSSKTGEANTSCDTYLRHLDLGDAATPQDMQEHIDCTKIESLQMHNFAFILRSDGEWTYSIIAHRQDGCMLFVVDTEGSFKIVLRKHWPTRIRLVNTEQKPWPSSPSTCLLSDEDVTQVIAHPIGAFPPPPFGQSSSAGRTVFMPQDPQSRRSSPDSGAVVIKHMKYGSRNPSGARRQSLLSLFD